jgi:hypothetical protein
MSPEVDQILLVSASQLMSNVAPLLPDAYAQGHAALLSFVMIMSAHEYDRAADIRAQENADMRGVFREFGPNVSDTALRASLESAAETQDESLAISALNKSNAELRRLLIALQMHIEDRNDRGAQARIWDVLKRSAERRLVKLA